MNEGDQFISLEPFPGSNFPAGLEIRCSLKRCEHVLSVSWELAGNPTEVFAAPPAEVPARKDDLWKDTCFELFLARRNFQNYWEFNLSPSGDWNVYRFDSYREGMREEDAFYSLPVRVMRDGSIWLEVDLGRIVPTSAELDLSVSAVIRGADGKVSLWAPVHRGPKPDFHRRDSFVIRG